MKHLLLLHLKIIRNRFLGLTFLDEVKAAVLLLVIIVLFGAVYAGSWRLVSHVNGVAVVGPLLVNKLLSLVFLTSFSMVVFSGLITSFTTIYFSRDLYWLMATPLPARHLFAVKALDTTFYSSWMVLVALAPFLFALGQVKEAGPGYYAGIMALLVPFLIIASLAGILIGMLLMRFFPAHRTRDILLFLGVVFLTGLYVLFRFMQPERLVKPDGMEVVAQYLAYLDAPTAVFLPSWWLTAGACSLISGSTGDVIFYTSLLVGGAVLSMTIVIVMAQRFFFVGWAEGQVFRRRKNPKRPRLAKRGAVHALMEKDFRTFFRDANQWSQLLLLGALVLVYLFSIYKLPLDTMYLQNVVSFFNVALIGFMLAAVALRLVFPLVSLEGESLWLLRAAPLSAGQFLWAKLLFGGIPVVIFGTVLVLVSSWLLKADTPVFLISLAAILLMAAGLSAMATGFGAVFPRFGMTNIAQIESSPGGLFYILTALFYLGLNVSLWAVPVRNYYAAKFGVAGIPWDHLWWIGPALAAVNGAAFVIPLWLGLRSLKRLER